MLMKPIVAKFMSRYHQLVLLVQIGINHDVPLMMGRIIKTLEIAETVSKSQVYL